MSSWDGEAPEAFRAARAWGRMATLAGLIGAGLLLGPVGAGAAERGVQQAARPAKKVSPYVRYARDHARTAEKKAIRVRPSVSHTGHGPRGGARAGRR